MRASFFSTPAAVSNTFTFGDKIMPRLLRHLGDQEFAVIGLGRFGRALAVRLEETGHSVLGLDRDPAIVQEVANDLTEVVVLDATIEDALLAAGIPDFNTVIVAIGRDFEAAALCVATLKTLGVPNVIVQARSDRHGQLFTHIGADRVVKPLQTGGERLAEELGIPALLKRLDLGDEYSIAEIAPPASILGKRLSDLEWRETQQINILLIRRAGDIMVSPSADTVVREDDVLVALGPTANILALADY